MDDEGWEARMAERTRLRREAERVQQIAEDEADRRKDVETVKATMTPDEAAAVLARPSHWCACLGGPNCCINVFQAAREILAARAPSPVD